MLVEHLCQVLGIVIGVVAAYDMVAQLDDGHLRAPHPYGGVLALVVSLAVVGLGLMYLRSKDLKNCKVAKSNSLIERYMEKSVAGFEKQLSDWIKAHKKVLGMPNAKQRLPMR